jgi:replicative DNA helicase
MRRPLTATVDGRGLACCVARARRLAYSAALRGWSMAAVEQTPGKVPPHSIEAEEAVLGGILLDNTAVDRVLELVTADDFYREPHRRIMNAMIDLNSRLEPVDLVTLADTLKSRGDLQDVGGAAYLAELVERVPTSAHVSYYARIIKEKSVLRQLIQTANEISMRCYEAQGDVENFLDEAEHRVYAIAERKTRPSFFRVRDIVVESMKAVEQLYERRELVTGVPSGFTDLDRKTAGLQRGDLVIVAGRPSMGKTALALNFAEHAALEAQTGVAVFSLEMSKEQLVFRLLCSEARVDQSKVRAGFAAERDYPKLAIAAERLAEAPIYIDDTPALGILELRAKARRLKREREANLGLIVVDYLQLMRGITSDSREQEISSISRSLKALAKELSVPVVALSQLNRQVESRADKRPVMADLRESGAIEQDADVILFLYRPWVYDPKNADEREAEIIIGKQRNGPTGTVALTFFAEFTRFENRAEEEVSFGEDFEEV